MTTLKIILATPVILAITWWATKAGWRKDKEEERVEAAGRVGAMEEDR